jgi:CHRD domain
MLVVNVGWGSLQGFTDLSSPVTAAFIHGPTPNDGGNNFIETAAVLFDLTTSTNGLTTPITAANGGTIAERITLTVAQEAELLAGRYYINIFTVNNPAGEIRGFLVPGGPFPSVTPSLQPTQQPSQAPSMQPTQQPSQAPSSSFPSVPSVTPSFQPSHRPSRQPSVLPSNQPS